VIGPRLAARALAQSIPWSAYAELTYACNWRCVFCYNPRHKDLRRMNAAEWTAVLQSLRRLGTLQLALTGGEPLAHPDFFAIARAARGLAFALRIFTNGALIDDGAAGEIAALDPLAVELSLHGATAEVHDRTTATPGSFAAMWKGVERLQEHRVRIVLKTPVTSINEAELDAVIALCAERGLPLRLDANMTPRDDGDLSPLNYSASPAAKRRVMTLAAQLGAIRMLEREQGGTNCGIGRVTLVVDPEGNVFPCMQWRERALGNVRAQSLEQIWAESEQRQEVMRVSVAANDAMMELGGVAEALPFCPALAMQRTGSAVTPDPEYLTNAALARAVLTGE
jgi:mycofactocin biosynthetic radical S-adenosylmethionine protein MftC